MPSVTPSPRIQTPSSLKTANMAQSDYFREATTSRVTLDEYRKRKLDSREHDIEALTNAYNMELRELYYMLSRQERLEVEGSPAIPPPDDIFLVDKDDEKYTLFAGEYSLTSDASKSVMNLHLPSLETTREIIMRDMAKKRKLSLPIRPRPELTTTKSENRGMPPPPSTVVKIEGGTERPRRATLQSSKSSSQPRSSESQEKTPGLSNEPSQTAQSQMMPQITTAASNRSTSQSRQSNSMHPPPSPAPPPPLPVPTGAETPLHPTLQVMSPNPLSVTYASSLRPLPPDPFRRFTGAGVSGGAIHHRGHRKAPQLPTKNGVPPPSGPAGAGGVDLFKWAVRARASPGAGLVGKADKCLLTNDWKVAFTEQKFIRAMNRIEKLKAEGMWSFRQPKKQKGPVVRKAHWDHLLEEMKWLQTDFREERRWKIAVAFQLASAAKDWVKAKTPQARAKLTIKSRPPRYLDERIQELEKNSEDVFAQKKKAEAKAETVKDPEADEEMKDANDAGTKAAAEVVDEEGDVEADADADADMDAPGEDIDAEGEDEDAEGDADDGEVEAATRLMAMDEPIIPPIEVVHEARGAANHMPALSDEAKNQVTEINNQDRAAAGSEPTGVKTDAASKDSTLADQLPVNLISTVRAPIFSMDVTATLVSPLTLLENSDQNALAQTLGISAHELGESVSLDQLNILALFPELPLFDAPSASESAKSDRRWDEGSLNQPPRLTLVSRLLDSKPLLVSTLQPAKNRSHNYWKEDGEWNIAAELADPMKGVSPEVFDAPTVPASLLFSRKSNKPSRDAPSHSSQSSQPTPPSQPDIRANLFLWTTEEDDYLTLLSKQYGMHWQLISDLFNSTRLSVPTDIRESWDCFDRYQKIQQAALEGKRPPTPAAFATEKNETQSTTQASNTVPPSTSSITGSVAANSLAYKREKLTKRLGLKYDGSRKKLRRVNITDVMKKCAKKREAIARNVNTTKRVNLQSHETHNQVKFAIIPTPQQLSALKAERDEASMRQFIAFQQAQRAQAQQAQAQAQAQAQQAQQVAVQAAAAQGQNKAPVTSQQQQQQQQQLHQQQQAQQQQFARQAQQQQQSRPPASANANLQQRPPVTQAVSTAGQSFARPAPGNLAVNTTPTAPNAAAGTQGRMPAQAVRPPVASNSNTGNNNTTPLPLQALQQTLTQSLSNNPSFTQEQIHQIALQLYRQAQQNVSMQAQNAANNNNNTGTGTAVNNQQQQQSNAATATASPRRLPATTPTTQAPAISASSPAQTAGKAKSAASTATATASTPRPAVGATAQKKDQPTASNNAGKASSTANKRG